MTEPKSFRLWRLFTFAFWQVNFQYRIGALTWAINGLISPILLMVVWVTVSRSGSLSMNQSQIMTYYVFSMLVFRLTQSWVAEELTFTIREGRFAKYLIRPTPFLLEWVAKDAALRLIRVSTVLPLLLIIGWFSVGSFSLSLDPVRWVVAALAIILGYLTNLLIESMVGISTFWLDDAYGTFLMLMLTRDIFSGILVPLALMPPLLQSITQFFPFYIQLGFPIDTIMGTLPERQMYLLLGQAIVWVVLLAIAYKYYYAYTVRKYTAEGI